MYIYFDHRQYREEVIINNEKNNIRLFLIKNKRIDAMIIGGSNAVLGISQKKFRRFS